MRLRCRGQAKWIMNAVEKFVTLFVQLLLTDQAGAAVPKRQTLIGPMAPILSWLLPETLVCVVVVVSGGGGGGGVSGYPIAPVIFPSIP